MIQNQVTSKGSYPLGHLPSPISQLLKSLQRGASHAFFQFYAVILVPSNPESACVHTCVHMHNVGL